LKPGGVSLFDQQGEAMQRSTSKRVIALGLIVAAFIVHGNAARAQDAKTKPRIEIIATGGTIAGAQSSKSEYGYKSAAFDVNDLINAVPQMRELAAITGEQVVNIGSQDMNDQVWLKLAKRINQRLASGEVDGIVVTHGTDTMEETSYFIDLVTPNERPIVLTGSMRPATAIGADGPANLYNAVAVAASREARGRGVLVVLNDSIHLARNVAKTNTTNVETFRSPNRGPVGLVNTGKFDWFDRPEPVSNGDSAAVARAPARGGGAPFSVEKLDALPRVDILYAHANMSADLIDAAVKAGAKGLVIAGVGDGNMTQQALDRLAQAAKDGVVVVRSTRLPQGVVLRNNEVNDDKLGFVASGELNPAKSRVLLQLALTRTRDAGEIQKMFYTY
jgi:L-asparaginase